MRYKKILGSIAAAVLAMSTVAAFSVTANAAEITLKPVKDTYVEKNDATDHSTVTELKTNMKSQISLFTFDISTELPEDATITGAEFCINIASRSFNSETKRNRWEDTGLILQAFQDEYDAATVKKTDWDGYNKEMLSNASVWTDKVAADVVPSTGTTPYSLKSFDVSDYVMSDEDGKFSFSIDTSTGREHGIASMEDEKNAPKLIIKYVQGESQVTTTFNRVYKTDAETVILSTEQLKGVQSATYSYSSPKYIEKNGTYYALKGDDYTVTGNYVDGVVEIEYVPDTAGDIVYFCEAEKTSNPVNIVNNPSYSSGQYAAIEGRKKPVIGELESGVYEIETYLVGNAGRCIFLRDGSKTDDINHIFKFIEDGAATGLNKAAFTLTEKTNVTVAGKDTTTSNGGATTNQSADFDYILIRKTGEYVPPAVEVVSVAPTGVAAPVLADDTELTLAGTTDTATYADLKGEKTLTTFYIKVNEVAEGAALPVVTLSNGAKLEGTQATAIANCFIYQYLGDAGVKAVSASYNSKTWTAAE